MSTEQIKVLSMDDFAEDLSEVLRIKKNVFISDNNDQDIYDIVLAFTQFFNDFRDLTILRALTRQSLDDCQRTNNKLFGQHGGMGVFIDKVTLSFLYEFIILLKKNNKVFEKDAFKKIIEKLQKNPKKVWDNLLALSQNEKNTVHAVLLLLRNNLGFHYHQPKILSNGYCLANKSCSSMFVSMGSTMAKTRYFFIDLAGELAKYKIIHAEGMDKIEDWSREINKLEEDILLVTMNIVRIFICSRCAPELAKEEDIPSFEKIVDSIKEF